MSHGRRAPIRAQLLALAAAVALPLLGAEAWSLYRAAEEHAGHARRDVLNLAQITALQTATFLDQARNILNGLAARPALRALDPARCDAVLKDFVALAPRFADAVTIRRDGAVACSAVPLSAGQAARWDPGRFLGRLRGPDELTVGIAAPGVTAGRWVVPVGRPLLDARGEVAGAVVLPIELSRLPLLPSVEALPPRSITGLMAGDGTILARSLEAERFVGTRAGAGRPAQLGRSGTAELMGIDGVMRIQGFAPVPGTDWMAIASIPAAEVYGPARERIARNAIILAGAALAALLLALGLGRGVAAPIRALGAAARAAGAGDLAARAPVAGAAEVAAAAADFNRMIESRAAAERLLGESEERFRKVFLRAPVPMSISDADSGALRDVNDAFCAFFGYARGEAIGRTSLELGLWADPGERARITERLAAEGRVRGAEARRRLRSGEERDVMISVERLEIRGERCTLAVLADISERRAAEGKVAAQLEELRRWYAATLGREDRMRELKQEVNALRARLGEAPRYGGAGRPGAGKEGA